MRRFFAFAIVTLAAALSLPQQTKSGNPPVTPSAAENWIAAWNSHDTAKWAAYFSSGVYYEDVTFSEISRGLEEAKKFAGEFFEAVPDLKLELEDSSIEGNHGSIQWILSAPTRASTKPERNSKSAAQHHHRQQRQISRSLDYYDSATIMKQVGLCPLPEPTTKN